MSAIFALLICVLGAVFMRVCGILIYAFCFALCEYDDGGEGVEAALAKDTNASDKEERNG